MIMLRNELTMLDAFERAMQGKSVAGDVYVLTGERSYSVPDESMPVEEAMRVVGRFFSLPETTAEKV